MNEPCKLANKTKSYTIASFYNDYLKGIESDTVYDIDYSKYRAIVVDYFRYLQKQLIDEGRCVKLPYRMGTIQIIKKKPKYYDKRSLRIDYLATKQTGKLIFLLNEHSDEFKYRMHWSKTDVMVPNKSMYLLVMTRANKRNLAQIIKQKIRDYEEI